MIKASASELQTLLVAEIGQMRFEAIRHFLSDGDYKAFNESDFAGAFADYMEAWSLLGTRVARSLGGSDIVKGISEFAASSGDPELQTKAAALASADYEEMSD